MYRTLNTLCNSSFSNALTTSTKYPCPSLAISQQDNDNNNSFFPPDPFFSPPEIPPTNISNDRFQTREYYRPTYPSNIHSLHDAPVNDDIMNGYILYGLYGLYNIHGIQDGISNNMAPLPSSYNNNNHHNKQGQDSVVSPENLSSTTTSSSFLAPNNAMNDYKPPLRTPLVSTKNKVETNTNANKEEEITRSHYNNKNNNKNNNNDDKYIYQENKNNDEPQLPSSSQKTTIQNQDMSALLPVMDCRFNMREMCKQSILLEDHLSHDEKRCMDCCMKHFLFLEGLCEEAVTLDTEQKYKKELQELCKEIRRLQHEFSTDPSHNAHYCSQELRKIRKKFQPHVFDMIFKKDNESCSGFCSYKPFAENENDE